MACQPELDGIRAIAIVAVLLFHGGIQWLAGGFLGVDVFFVLSGYLITRLLISEQLSAGRIDVPAFYLRRARRLLPALLVMLLTSVTCAALFMKDVIVSTVRDLPWAFAGLSNWWFIFHRQSYFEAMGRPQLFQHTWSLAVEAQFYLIWPVALSLLLPAFGAPGVRRAALACGAISASALLVVGSGIDVIGGAASSHAYFGTDTHSIGLFLGAALAAGRLSTPSRCRLAVSAPRPLVDVFGALAFVALLALFHVVGEPTSGLYRFGLPLASILSMILIAVATLPGGIVGKCLAARPLRWVGERSYGMYIWHWPTFQATRPGIDLALSGILDLLLRLALTAAIAELSYRFVEMPVRRGAVRRLWSISRSWNQRALRFATASTVAGVLVIAAAETTLVSNAMGANAEPLKTVVAVGPIGTSISPGVPKESMALTSTAISGSHRQAPRPKTAASHRARSTPAARGAHARSVLKIPAILLGDSVMLGVSPWIAQQVNVVKVDAVVARQATEVRDRVERMAEAGGLHPTIIVNLGNNGTVDEPTLRAILHTLRTCQRVVVVNARVPRPWQDEDDALLARIVPTYPNAVLADWREASAGHPEYFGPDGVHPNVLGARAYANLVVSALELVLLQRLAQTK